MKLYRCSLTLLNLKELVIIKVLATNKVRYATEAGKPTDCEWNDQVLT